MKKLTKIISCLTAAVLVCSAGALTACGSGDETGDKAEENIVSDVVTEDEWKAAFADENFYNVTINSVYSYAAERNGTTDDGDNNISYYSKEYQSGDYDSVYKCDLISADEIMTGSIYSCINAKEVYQYKFQNEDYPEYDVDTDETTESTSYLYYIYDEQGYDTASKSINDGEEGEWTTYSRSVPLYVELFSLRLVDYFLPNVIFAALNQEFEYKDGAYTYSFETDYINYIEPEIIEGFNYEVTEFTGGVTTYSVIIKDGKVYSLKSSYSYTLGINVYYSDLDIRYSYESENVSYEYIFSDYGTTTVTVPDDVTALFE